MEGVRTRVAVRSSAAPARLRSTWSGTLALGPGHAVFVGRSGDNALHAHVAVQVCVARRGNVGLQLASRRRITGSGIVVPSGVAHRLDEGDCDVVLVYLDPFGPAGRALATACGVPESMVLANGIVRRVRSALGREPIGESGPAILEAIGMDALDGAPRDTRVRGAIEWIEANAGLGAIAAARVASEVGLSPSRLAALFREQTGLTMRRFVLWTRLRLAVAEIVRGTPLTAAALGAGFADSAHLARTFRRMFGATLSRTVVRLELAE